MKTVRILIGSIKQKIRSHSICFVFLMSLLAGAICFVSLYGFKVLNVTNIDWLMNGEDLSQHYLGWVFYRKSKWSPIIGLMENMVYPGKVSIVYTDSIPLFAVIFKVLSPILPEKFQYFGIWGLICFMLQGGISALIIKKYTKNIFVPILSSILFCVNSVLLQRMFVHSALAGNWIILLALLVFVNREKLKGTKRELIIWSLVAVLASSVHMYYVPMVFCILFFYLIKNVLDDKKVMRFALVFGVSVLTCLANIYILGGFYGQSEYAQGGLGAYSANLNTLYNTHFGVLLKEQPLYIAEQWEGSGYLGVGFLLLLFLAVISCVDEFNARESLRVKFLRQKSNLLVFAMLLVFTFFAVSPTATFNEFVLYEIQYNQIIINVLSIFRASGRFIWPVSYVIMIFSLRKVIKKYSTKVTFLIIVVCSIIQIYDFSVIINSVRTRYYEPKANISTLQSTIWDDIVTQYEGIVFLCINEDEASKSLHEQFPVKVIFDLADYAAKNDMYLSDFHISRADRTQLRNDRLSYFEAIKNRTIEGNHIYVFDQNPYLLFKNSNLNFYQVDGLYIGLVEPLEAQCPNEKIAAIDINNGYEVDLLIGCNTIKSEKGYLFDKGGVCHGNFKVLEEGRYQIEIIGGTIQSLDIQLLYKEQELEIKNMNKEQEMITFEFECESTLEDIQLVISNNNYKYSLVETVRLFEIR